jgi:hypothetical protein
VKARRFIGLSRAAPRRSAVLALSEYLILGSTSIRHHPVSPAARISFQEFLNRLLTGNAQHLI